MRSYSAEFVVVVSPERDCDNGESFFPKRCSRKSKTEPTSRSENYTPSLSKVERSSPRRPLCQRPLRPKREYRSVDSKDEPGLPAGLGASAHLDFRRPEKLLSPAPAAQRSFRVDTSKYARAAADCAGVQLALFASSGIVRSVLWATSRKVFSVRDLPIFSPFGPCKNHFKLGHRRLGRVESRT